MFAKEKINKKLIAKYLTGNCSDAEKLRVEQWINASVKNAELFRQYKSVWAYTAAPSNMPSFNSHAALEKVNSRIQKLESSPRRMPLRKHRISALKNTYRYAAGIAAVMLIAFTSYLMLQPQQDVQMATQVAETKLLDPVVLPDGSSVYLNAGSVLSYPEAFTGNLRQVNLEGEAFFEIAGDASKPFIVTSGNLAIKVLGTSFNLNASAHLNTVEVAILSGKVLFYSFDPDTENIREQIILNQGEKGIYHKYSGAIVRTTLDNSNSIGWKSGELEFSNTPLPEVFKALESTYNLRFEFDRNLSNMVLTARFNQEEPENVLETLQLIFGFNIEKSGNEIRIY